MNTPEHHAEAILRAAGTYCEPDHYEPDEWQAILSAVREAMEAEWLPIDSAPVSSDKWAFSETFMAFSSEEGVFPCKASGGKFYNLECVDRDGDWDVCFPDPTHWQPLPTPPRGE